MTYLYVGSIIFLCSLPALNLIILGSKSTVELSSRWLGDLCVDHVLL